MRRISTNSCLSPQVNFTVFIISHPPTRIGEPPHVDYIQHRGVCILPKLGCDVMACEIIRLLKVTNNSIIPVRFGVVRKSYSEFHADLFPDTRSNDPALTQDEWFSGITKPPLLVSLAPSSSSISQDTSQQTQPQEEQNPQTKQHHKTQEKVSVADRFTEYVAPSSENRNPLVSSETKPSSDSTKTTAEENEDEYYVPKQMNIVRQTKFSNIFGKPDMKNSWYTNLKVNNDAMLTRTLAVNNKFFAVPWEGVAGRIGVFPLARKGKFPDKGLSVVETGAKVLDFEFNPFNQRMLVTAGENGHIKVWQIPSDTGLMDMQGNLREATADLLSHSHKVVSVDFHPLANNLLISTSGDLTAKLWDLARGQDVLTLKGFSDLVTSVTWNWNGSLMATDSRDRKIRLFDPRQNRVIFETEDIGGAQGSAVTWLGNRDHLCCVGFTKQSERRMDILDIRSPSQRLASQTIDQGSGFLTPFFDNDTGVLLLWGKGDGKIIFYEVVNESPFVYPLVEYKTNVPQIGIALQHKTQCNVREVEIFRLFKLTLDTLIPISICVPRTKKEYFQDDVYPPTRALEPVLSAEEWFGGQNGEPKLISLQPPDMKPLSQVPKVVRKVKRFNPEDDTNDPKKFAERVLNKFHSQVQEWKEDTNTPLPGDDKEGVAPEEWDN